MANLSRNKPEENEGTDKSPEQEKGLFQMLRQGLSKTRSTLTGRLDRMIFGEKEITDDLLEDLEEILITSDIGVRTTQELIDLVKINVARKELNNPRKIKSILREYLLSFLEVPSLDYPLPAPGEPLVIMVVGVNGVGKTTTIAKAAHNFILQGKEVMLVAADTFRAAAPEQLIIWGERVGASVIRQTGTSDPSAVVFDALSTAISGKVDVVLIDTAGRLHTKKNLMEELRKIHRVAGRKLPGAPHEVWLVLDATTGQNAISQAEIFNKSIDVTGIILTKLDSTSKGGIVAGISHHLKIPVKYIGIGEKADDLKAFNPEDFIKAIFD